jgi:DNA-binding transcriptional LysR family regulator/DNA-binding CsgD family transcriptional regulator
MDLQDLRGFHVLAEELSFSAAARRLHVSEPTLSKRVQRLEERLGVTLVDPTPSAEIGASGVSVTPQGAWVASRATALLDEWQCVADQVHMVAAEGPAGGSPRAGVPVRLAVRSLGVGLLQSYLSGALPAHEVSVSVMSVFEAVERLEAGDGVDVVLIFDPDGGPLQPRAPGAHVATLVVEPVWVLIGPQHPLADRDEITVQEIAEYGLPWILSPPDDPMGQWEETFLLSRAPKAQLRREVGLSKVSIARGQAVGLASPNIAPNELIDVRPLKPPAIMHLYLTWLPDRFPSAVAADLVTAMRGFYRHTAQQNPRYWRWILDHPTQFPGIAPDPPSVQPTGVSSTVGSPLGAPGLSGREREVLTLIGTGLNEAEIARELQLSPLTAKTHVQNLRAKLGARDRAQLVVLAYQLGMAG